MTAPAKAAPMREDVTQIVAWLRWQSDLGANRGNEADKGTTKRAAFGGGSLALKRAADAIESGEYLTNDNCLAHTARPDAGHPTYSEAITTKEASYARSLIAEMLHGEARAIDRAIIDDDDRVLIQMRDVEALMYGLIVSMDAKADSMEARPDAGDEDVERVGIFLPLDDRAKEAIQNAATFLDSAAGEGIEIDGLDAMEVVNVLHELLVEDPSQGFHEDVAQWLKGRIEPTVPEDTATMREGVDRGMVQFLLDRLADFENGMTSEEDASEWHGHVRPAIARLSAALDTEQHR